ncbi:unnamed protein product [Hymenolepis diminuta]|nr:unnamed protein product [Hymenolepis diminuta]
MSGALLPSIPPSSKVFHPANNNTHPSSLILFFLPPNTSYTSVRNQARQKLGRLSMTAFRALVVDVLHEAAHRLVPMLESTSALPLAVVRPKMRHEYTTFGAEEIKQETRMTVNNDDEVLLVVGSTPGQGGPGISPRNRTTNGTNTSFEDPVYDQVAVDTETGTVTRVSTAQSLGTTAISSNASISNSASATTAAIAPTDFNNSTTEQQMQLESQADEEEDPTSQQQIFVSMGEESLSSDAPHTDVDSRPGVVLGSRRLHLPATGHLASYRASVPASAHSNAYTGISKQTTAAVAGVASTAISSSSTCGGSLERCVGPTMLHQSVEGLRKEARFSLVSAAVQTSAEASEMEASEQNEQSDSRFTEVEAEVIRLKEEREKAAQQVQALTTRLRELEAICERLTEENNALKAAFSAGMVKTHEAAARSSSTPKQSTPPVDLHTRTTSSVITATEGEGERTTEIHGSATEISEDNSDLSEDDEDGEGYTNGNLHGPPKPQSVISGNKRLNGSSSNYAVGTQCLDSGILLRQGISLWGRSTSPADATTVEVTTTTTTNSGQPTNASQLQPSTSTQAGLGAVRSYVNLQNTKPSAARTPIGKTQPTSSPLGGGLHEVEVPDDYTAPNETGTPSPAPPVVFSTQTGRCSSSAGVLRTSSATPTTAAVAPHQFDAIRTSGGGPETSTSQVDYSIPPPAHPSSSTGLLKKTPPVHPVSSSGGGPASWKHPPYERIVRGVECIIVRIRALLDAANARRLHEQVRSSQLIQAAVQDLVVLFPPISKCHPTVGSALTSLMSNSQKLRLHCEANAEQSASSVSPRSSSSSSNQLITFAHEIASAAKTILNFFQAERH